MTKYRIAWRSRFTGFVGRGGYIFDNEDDAKRVCKEESKEYPDVVHWVEAADERK